MNKCSFCYTENEDGATVCRNCGAEYGVLCGDKIKLHSDCEFKDGWYSLGYLIIATIVLFLIMFFNFFDLDQNKNWFLMGFGWVMDLMLFLTIFPSLLKVLDYSPEEKWHRRNIKK